MAIIIGCFNDDTLRGDVLKGMGSSRGLPIFAIYTIVFIRARGFGYLKYFLYINLMVTKQNNIKDIKDVVKQRNELLMKMAFSSDEEEVSVLWKQIEKLEYIIRVITFN